METAPMAGKSCEPSNEPPQRREGKQAIAILVELLEKGRAQKEEQQNLDPKQK